MRISLKNKSSLDFILTFMEMVINLQILRICKIPSGFLFLSKQQLLCFLNFLIFVLQWMRL